MRSGQTWRAKLISDVSLISEMKIWTSPLLSPAQLCWLVAVVGVGGGADWRCSGDRMVSKGPHYSPQSSVGRQTVLSHQSDCASLCLTGTDSEVINQNSPTTLSRHCGVSSPANQLMLPIRLQSERRGSVCYWSGKSRTDYWLLLSRGQFLSVWV